MSRLLVVDGHGMMYRSHFAFAKRPLTNNQGEQTSVIYGSMQVVNALIEKYKPQEMVVVFDPKGKTRKHAMFESYKANRRSDSSDATNDARFEVWRQKSIVREFLKASGVHSVSVRNWEADEVIAAVIRSRNTDTALAVSDDKDMLQILCEGVMLVKIPIENDPIDHFDFVEKYGMQPWQFCHMQALMGDGADNIAGVPGIGPVKAKKLIQDFRTVQDLYAAIHEVENARIRALLEENKQVALDSLKLTQILPTAPLPTHKWPLRGESSLELAALRNKYMYASIEEDVIAAAAAEEEE